MGKLWVVGCGLWVVGCGLWVVGCGSFSCGLLVRVRRAALAYGFQAGVLEDEGFAAGFLELDDRTGVLAHVGNLGDLAQAKSGVTDDLALAELGGQAAGVALHLLRGTRPRRSDRTGPCDRSIRSSSAGISFRNGEVIVRSRKPRMVR